MSQFEPAEVEQGAILSLLSFVFPFRKPSSCVLCTGEILQLFCLVVTIFQKIYSFFESLTVDGLL